QGNLIGKLDSANSYLQKNTDFNSFNRAAFITGYGNPVTTGITNLQKQLHISVIRYNRLLRQDAATLFDKNAFDVNAYAPSPEYFVTDKKVALGKKLFSDPILSGNQSRSCASCHQPEEAFSDGLVKNTLINGKGLLRRNTPTLLNAALQPSQFYDLRAATLEDQATDVIQSKDEMHGNMQTAVKRIWCDKTYRQLFSEAFPKKDRTAIDTLEVTNALGSFVRSLTRLDSRFDEYMRGNKTAMNEEELNGFNLFMGKAKCATCHYMPLFNGTFPPKYIRIEAEIIGVPQTLSGKTIDPDMGSFDILNISSFKHAFKTTTVRNAARTAPYMHNGVFKTLDEVIDFYNKGGGAGMGIKIDNQTLSADQLQLSPKETAALVAFIKSLDSK
ncbi:MAG TPA: cytochrome c peroxidase, partial [Pedobacter sp.]